MKLVAMVTEPRNIARFLSALGEPTDVPQALREAPSPPSGAVQFMMASMTRTKATETMWAERVRAWRESGETAEEFARSRGFATSTLHGWSSRLSRAEPPRFLRLVPKAPAVTSSAPELVVEVGGARVRVAAGFDPALLAEVVRALGGAAR